MSISIAARKQKGRKLQQQVRDTFREVFKGQLEDGDIESTPMSSSGVDIILSPSAKKLIPFNLECKHQQALNLTSALNQAEENTPADRISLLIFKRNREQTYCAMKFEELIKLLYPDRIKEQ